MSAPRYIIDTSIVIDLVNKYPRDVFGKHWEQFEALIASGEIISHAAVYRELSHTSSHATDPGYKWARKHMSLFHKDQKEITEKAFELVRKHPNLIDPSKEYEDADPYLIALSMAQKNCPLVTGEKGKGYNDHSRIKIPDVCGKYNIESYGLLEFFREAKILG